MKYPQILSKVYGEPWCITREKYQAIHATLQARLNGDMAAGVPSASESDENTAAVVSGTMILPAFGILGKHLSNLEMMCGGCSVDGLSEALDEALNDPRIGRVVIYWNSPGGVLTGIPELADKMADFAEQKTLISFCDDTCCSAALWLASQSQRFYCTESACIGSVGVYRIYVDETKSLEMDGIKVTPISAGKYKLMGAPFRALTDEEIQIANQQVGAIKAQFDEAVLSNRTIEAQYLEGQVFYGEEAAKIGMVDGLVADIEEVLEMPDE